MFWIISKKQLRGGNQQTLAQEIESPKHCQEIINPIEMKESYAETIKNSNSLNETLKQTWQNRKTIQDEQNKSRVINFGLHKFIHDIDNVKIENVTEMKFLGITINSKMAFR